MNRTLINWAGPYSPSAMYCVGDLATSGGAGYVSQTFPNEGNPLTDTAHWAPIGVLSDATSWATLAHAAIVTINGGTGGGSKAVPMLTWPAPAGITFGAALSAAQLNCSSNALGTFTYSPPLGTVPNAGTQTLTVTFTPLDTTVYASSSATVTLAVAKATPAIAWPPPPSLLYTDALSAIQLNASASCPGTFSYTPASGATLPLGTATLSATFTPSDLANYISVTTTQTLAVTSSFAPPALVKSAHGSAPTNTAALSLALPAAPTPGNLVTAVICYSIYTDYDYLAPDPSWTVTTGGRSGASANSSNRVGIYTHVAVPGDPASFTFFPGANQNGTVVAAAILETSNSSPTPQIAFGLIADGSGAQPTPALTPTAIGSLALSGFYPGLVAPLQAYTNTPAPGWSGIPALGLALALESSPDASTPVANTFIGYSLANTLTWTILYAPAALCSTPAASPTPGSYPDTETVALACTTPGATIHYTLDGSLPTTSSSVYSAPFSFDRSTTLAVLATAPGYSNSGPAFYKFVIAPGTIRGVELGPYSDWRGYLPFAGDSIHTRVDTLPVDANSSAILSLMSTTQNHLEPDTAIGINWVDSTPGQPWTTTAQLFSPNLAPSDPSYGGDLCPYPIPANVIIEDNPAPSTFNGGADQHAMIGDRHTQAFYEMWRVTHGPVTASRPTFYAASAAVIFDLTLPNTMQHNYTQTTADAGGLSVIEGLARYDEVMAAIADGSMCLKHAIRMDSAVFGAASVGSSGYGYFQSPAMHSAPTGRQDITDANLIWYGMQIRLQAAWTLPNLSLVNQVFLNTYKKFGWYLADIAPSHSFAFNIAQDPRWDSADLQVLYNIPATALEVVQRGTILNGANYPTGPQYVPVIQSFTASATTVARGTPVTLNATWTHGTFGFVDKVGVMRSGVPLVFTPATPGSLTLKLTVNGLNLLGDDGTGDGTPVTATLTLTVT